MAQLHMTEVELARDLHAVLEKIRQGVEVVVEHDRRPVVILRSSDPPRRRVSEVLALMPKDSTATMDEGFARDSQVAIDSHSEPDPGYPAVGVGLILDSSVVITAGARARSRRHFHDSTLRPIRSDHLVADRLGSRRVVLHLEA